jgi:metallo-beta-lactamase family protein
MILVEVGRERKTLLFSGDLGRNDRPLVPDPSAPPAAGTVFVESTYGDRLHHEDVLVADQIATLVNATVAQGGSVLVPCFAVERAQELLFHLDALHTANRIPALPVFLDSPMALKILEVFRHHPEACDTAMRQRLAGGGSPFAFAGLHFCSTRDESKEINRQRGPAIIIAGSGMLNGGRIKHHLEQHLDRPESAIVFVGYQAAGTLGRQLVEGARQVRLFGRQREVRLKVAQIQGFSGHADRDELLAWLARQPAKPERIAVTHGGESVAPAFAALVQERIGVPAHAPTYLERIEV